MKFDSNQFTEQSFSAEELRKYYQAIKRDLAIASRDAEPEVIFHFSYMALLKIGMYLPYCQARI